MEIGRNKRKALSVYMVRPFEEMLLLKTKDNVFESFEYGIILLIK